jgi:hypothetical protein
MKTTKGSTSFRSVVLLVMGLLVTISSAFGLHEDLHGKSKDSAAPDGHAGQWVHSYPYMEYLHFGQETTLTGFKAKDQVPVNKDNFERGPDVGEGEQKFDEGNVTDTRSGWERAIGIDLGWLNPNGSYHKETTYQVSSSGSRTEQLPAVGADTKIHHWFYYYYRERQGTQWDYSTGPIKCWDATCGTWTSWSSYSITDVITQRTTSYQIATTGINYTTSSRTKVNCTWQPYVGFDDKTHCPCWADYTEYTLPDPVGSYSAGEDFYNCLM